MADTTIPEAALTTFLDALDHGNRRVAVRFPGDPARRQPIHVVYGGAHLFKSDLAQKLGSIARRTLQQHAATPDVLADAVGLDRTLVERIYPRVVDKLEREPV